MTEQTRRDRRYLSHFSLPITRAAFSTSSFSSSCSGGARDSLSRLERARKGETGLFKGSRLITITTAAAQHIIRVQLDEVKQIWSIAFDRNCTVDLMLFVNGCT